MRSLSSLSGHSKIQRAFGLFDGHTLNRVRVNHGCSHTAVTEQFLDGAGVMVRVEQVGGLHDDVASKGYL
jgi:hypothetical protein